MTLDRHLQVIEPRRARLRREVAHGVAPAVGVHADDEAALRRVLDDAQHVGMHRRLATREDDVRHADVRAIGGSTF